MHRLGHSAKACNNSNAGIYPTTVLINTIGPHIEQGPSYASVAVHFVESVWTPSQPLSDSQLEPSCITAAFANLLTEAMVLLHRNKQHLSQQFVCKTCEPRRVILHHRGSHLVLMITAWQARLDRLKQIETPKLPAMQNAVVL